jgi:hypothetical protein
MHKNSSPKRASIINDINTAKNEYSILNKNVDKTKSSINYAKLEFKKIDNKSHLNEN